MYVLRATKKLLDRLAVPIAAQLPVATGRLGNWYATILFWRPQIVLMVNERTLLPALLPFAPSVDLLERVPHAVGDVLRRMNVPAETIAAECEAMRQVTIAKTANRSVLGVVNQFAFEAQIYARAAPGESLTELALRLARSPSRPIGMECPADVARQVLMQSA
jgi:hypothetical protein